MRDRNEANFKGALGGTILSGIFWWDRLERRTQERLDALRDDTRQTSDRLNTLVSSGDFIRLWTTPVRDAMTGLALAAQATTPARAIPNLPGAVQRPDLADEQAAASYIFPPRPGVYDADGNVEGPGELTPFMLAQTYQEYRAFGLGLTQPKGLTSAELVQVFRVANALIATVAGQNLTWQQYKDAWTRLFGSQPSGTPCVLDSHIDPTRPPTVVGALGANVAAVVPLSSASIAGYPYANRNTDAAMRFRVTASNANPVAAGTALATIQFGTEYRYRDTNGSPVPFQPVVLASNTNATTHICPDSVTSSSFTLLTSGQINTGAWVDVFISVNPGLAAV